MNNSPWIKQLRRTRPIEPLDENLDADVVVIGGGIAGVTTAYFLLTQTTKTVLLLEGGKIAHGATGHNAGQISSYYEKSLADLVRDFGETKATRAQRIIEEDARALFNEIFSDTQLSVPRSEFVGYEACVTKEHVLSYLEELVLRAELGLRVRPLLVAREWLKDNILPAHYTPYILATPQSNILQLLETDNTIYIAAHSFLSGCVNSALFTERLSEYLLSQYKDRFVLREHTFVSKLTLNKDDVSIETKQNIVSGREVVLCTNGFEAITIVNHNGAPVDGFFHHEVNGVIGYMAGYKESLDKAPFASSYAHPDKEINELYTYVTRRPYEDETNATHNLVCIGGPEVFIPDRAQYDPTKEYPLDVSDAIDTFMMQTYGEKKTMDYQWHGLMGYTNSGVRLIGREPRNKKLLYNLGCNGVGILTSVYGSYRIAQLVNNEIVEPTIFDPKKI